MKKGIHPEYRPVVFRDAGANFAFLTRSTVETNKTIEWEDGNTYPLVELDISSASHPFYTGRQRIVDTGGRVQRFESRRRRRQQRSGEQDRQL
ncbi:MAG: type B 50S ribosomal protein L31 [Rubrobacter sp.]|nr:type B 50S ribosomal protein L31 [Rubrobacter sp.]